MIAYTLFVLAVGAERLVELAVSKRNLAWAFAHGGREYGRGHYPAMVLLHFGLLVGCVVEVWVFDRPFLPVLGWTWSRACSPPRRCGGGASARSAAGGTP